MLCSKEHGAKIILFPETAIHFLHYLLCMDRKRAGTSRSYPMRYTLLYLLIDDQSGNACEDDHDDGVNTVKTGADESEEEDEQARDELERAF
jgi:hypothetical protein